MNTPPPSPKLTPDQIYALLIDQHAHYCDDPLYNHISHSFEDMADILNRAEKCLKGAQEEAEWFANNPRNWTGSNVRNLSHVEA